MSWLNRMRMRAARAIAPKPSQRALPAPQTRPVVEVKHAEDLACDPCGGSSRRVGNDPRWTFKLNIGHAMPVSLWVYNCASLIANLVGSVPLVATYDGKRSAKTADSDLQRMLDTPVPGRRIGGGQVQGIKQREWMAERAFGMLLTGADYLHLRRTESGKLLSPSAVYRDCSRPAALHSYLEGQFYTEVEEEPPHDIEYYVRSYDALEVSERDCIRTRFVRPGDRARGLPPLEAAAREAAIDQNASSWQANSYDNRLIPDGMLVYDEPLTDAQWRQAQSELNEVFAGAMNARIPLVTGGAMGARWVELSRNAVEMDFINSRELNAEFICSAFKVPIVIFRSSSATYANLETAHYMLWDNAVLPLLDLLVEGLHEQLAPEFGEGWGVAADTSQVFAMLPQMKSRYELAERMMARGMSPKDASAQFGLGLLPFEGWDLGWVDSSRVPITMFIPGGGSLDGFGGEGE